MNVVVVGFVPVMLRTDRGDGAGVRHAPDAPHLERDRLLRPDLGDDAGADADAGVEQPDRRDGHAAGPREGRRSCHTSRRRRRSGAPTARAGSMKLTCPPGPTPLTTKFGVIWPARKLWDDAFGIGTPVGQTVRKPGTGRDDDGDVHGHGEHVRAGDARAGHAGHLARDRLVELDRRLAWPTGVDHPEGDDRRCTHPRRLARPGRRPAAPDPSVPRARRGTPPRPTRPSTTLPLARDSGRCHIRSPSMRPPWVNPRTLARRPRLGKASRAKVPA